jgi:hypothetical protein
MGYLADKKLYLSGAIEYANPNDNWRIEPMRVFRERFSIDVFDPFSDPKQQWAEKLKIAKKNRDFDEVEGIARLFVRKDLQIVQKTDILVAYLQPNVQTTGTIHEIINSWNYKNPTLLVSEHKEDIPSWCFGFVRHKYMFDGFSKLYEYLQEVDDGMHKDDLRWALIYGLI